MMDLSCLIPCDIMRISEEGISKMNKKQNSSTTISEKDIRDMLEEMRYSIEMNGMTKLDDIRWTDLKTRLYSRCYWVVFQKFVRHYNISLRRLCIRMDKKESVVSQMVYRNTFPSEKTIRPILDELARYGQSLEYAAYNRDYFQKRLLGLERGNAINTFFEESTPEEIRLLISEFVIQEKNRDSDVLKKVVRELRLLDEKDIIRVSDFIAWIRSGH